MLPAPYQPGQSMSMAEIMPQILLRSALKDPDAPKDAAAGRSLVTTTSAVNISVEARAGLMDTSRCVEKLVKRKGVTDESPQVKALWALNTATTAMLLRIGNTLPDLTQV